MSDSLGARLRRRRDEQGIALAAIAEETKIKLSLLEALERDDVTHWPSGIFRRAFVRAYAQAIGLNPDAVVREFVETYPDPEEVLAAALAAQAARSEANGGSARFRQMMGSALGSLARLRRGAPHEPAVPAEIQREIEPEDVPDILAPTSPVVAHAVMVEPAASEVNAAADPEIVVAAPAEEVRAETAIAEPPAPEPLLATETRDPQPAEPDYAAVAQLCTAFARTDTVEEAEALLKETARVLDATGVILWIGDELARELRATLSSGYSQQVLAHFPIVSADADNITAAAYRRGQPCAIGGGKDTSGALAVPLPAPGGCGGVLALELQHGREQMPSVRVAAAIVAAVLGQLVGGHASQRAAEGPAAPVSPLPPALRVVAWR